MNGVRKDETNGENEKNRQKTTGGTFNDRYCDRYERHTNINRTAPAASKNHELHESNIKGGENGPKA